MKGKGENIKLEFSKKRIEGENSFYNDMENSVVLTYNDMGKMKIYRSNDLIKGEIAITKYGIIPASAFK